MVRFNYNIKDRLCGIHWTLYLLYLLQASIGPYIGIALTDMISGEIEATLVVTILHLAFSILIPPYAVMGGMYYITRV